MRWISLVLILFLNACISSYDEGIKTEILAKCIANNGVEAKFKSDNPNYSEILIKSKVGKYKVGRDYMLILRKK